MPYETSTWSNGLELPYCSKKSIEERLQADDLWTQLTMDALKQAVVSHGDKLRNSGQPYLEEHVYPVAIEVIDYMQQRGKSVSEQRLVATVTLLHDTVEDDPTFDLGDCEKKFGRAVTRLVYPLTKFGVEKDIYFKKLMNAPNRVKVIKLKDRVNNLGCSVVIARERPEKLARYLVETEDHYLPIANQLMDKSLYVELENLVQLAHLALDDLENKTTE